MVAVRPARPAEAELVLELHQASIRAFGPAAYDDDEIAAWAIDDDSEYPIEEDDHRFVVAERRGALAGFGDLHLAEAEVTAVYVHPDHARVGVGSTILSDLERTARERGIETLGLLASKNAVDFYAKAGYGRIEPRVHETGGEQLECIWMEKDLE